MIAWLKRFLPVHTPMKTGGIIEVYNRAGQRVFAWDLDNDCEIKE